MLISPRGNAWVQLRTTASYRRVAAWFDAGGAFAGSPVRNAPYFVVAILLGLAHLGCTKIGWLLIAGGAQVTPVWPEAGFDIVALLLFGTRYWPVLLAANFVGILQQGIPWAPSVGAAIAAIGRALAGVALFKPVSRMKAFVGHFEDLVAVVSAGMLAPVVSTIFGTLSFLAAGAFPPGEHWTDLASRYWVADSLGILTVMPLLLAIARVFADREWKTRRPPVFRITGFACCVAAASYFVFFRPEASHLLFSVFLFIFIGTAWLGPLAGRLSALVISGAAIWATHLGVGVFTGGTLFENLQNLDLFLAAVSLTGVALGAFRASGSLALPATVLLAGWILSGWLFSSLERNRVSYDSARFDASVLSVENQIRTRLAIYETALRGTAGFLAASEHTSANGWRISTNRLGLLEQDPGTIAVEVIQPVPDAKLESFVAARRREDYAQFQVSSATPALNKRPIEHYITTHVEPPSLARIMLGRDVATEPRRKAAADQARDTGIATLTRKLEFQGRFSGLKLFVPVYVDGARLTTVAQRRAAFIAWVAMSITADTLFKSALASAQDVVGLSVFDDAAAPENLMFSSEEPSPARPIRFERTTKMELSGSTWILGWNRTPRFPFLSKTWCFRSRSCSARRRQP